MSTGHLIYVRLGTLMAVPFDPVRLAVIGGATGVIDDVMQAANRNLSDMDNTLSAQFTVSDTGALVYLTGGAVPAAERSLAWVDRQGTEPAAAGAAAFVFDATTVARSTSTSPSPHSRIVRAGVELRHRTRRAQSGHR